MKGRINKERRESERYINEQCDLKSLPEKCDVKREKDKQI